MLLTQTARPSLRFDRHELAGALGGLGTDLPLLIGVLGASPGLDAASVLILFGLMQVASGLWYRMPMPVQPLKGFAALVIAQRIPAPVIAGGGLAVGIGMLLLSVSGLLGGLARLVPKAVIRGIQLGLALQLSTLALKTYVPSDGAVGYGLAAVAFGLTAVLLGHRRYPAALVVVGLGVAWALAFRFNWAAWAGAGHAVGLRLPTPYLPTWPDLATGAVLLALPQIPLSLGNSVLATRQVVQDYFPERPLSVRQIGLTYALMNFVGPVLGGFPTCHGSGGLVGHYAYGARTGGSVVLYGGLYLTLGLFFSPGFTEVVKIFPLPVLGVLLLFEALTLAALLRDLAADRAALLLALLVGVVCANLPYGYLVGLLLGTAVHYAQRAGWLGWK